MTPLTRLDRVPVHADKKSPDGLCPAASPHLRVMALCQRSTVRTLPVRVPQSGLSTARLILVKILACIIYAQQMYLWIHSFRIHGMQCTCCPAGK